MKSYHYDPSLDYTSENYKSTYIPLNEGLEIPLYNTPESPVISDDKDIQLIVPFKNYSPVSLPVYHIIKNSPPEAFPQFYSTRTVDPLLLEGSALTLFTYQVTGLSHEGVDQVNSMHAYDISGRLKLIEHLGGNIQFHRVKEEVFKGNLEMIDTKIFVILAHELIYFYRDKISSCKDLIIKVANDNPLSLRTWGLYTLNKYRFLVALILGFTPGGYWLGHHHVGNAYQVLHRSGDSFLFHLDDKYNFHRKLLFSTYFDYVDPVKVGFGSIYSKENKTLIDLCSQVSLA